MPMLAGVCAAWLLIAAPSVAIAQVSDSGSGAVALSPRLTVTLPGVIELRLDASEIAFDLDGESFQTANLACVHGSLGEDPPAGAGTEADPQAAVLPLGTGFRHETYPAVAVEGAGPVHDYPPSRFDAGGGALPGSDRDFVCYRTFLLRRFANVAGWHLTVERPAEDATRGLGAIYVRHGGCAGGSGLQGLFPLWAGQRQVLAHAATSGPCPDGDVVVLAVKPGSVQAGDSRTRLVYTLMAPAFETAP